MTTFGYIRKSEEKALIEQIKTLQEYPCDELLIEERSYNDDEELQKLMEEYIQEGDCLVIESINDFGKNLRKLATYFQLLMEKNIRLISIQDQLDTYEKQNFFEIVQLLSNMDYQFHATQTRNALSKSKEHGAKAGRPKINEESIKRITYLYSEKKYTLRKIAELCSVSLGTVYKYATEIPSDQRRSEAQAK